MNIEQAKKAIRFALAIGRTANLIGWHGEGKSTVVKQLTKEMGFNYKEFRTGQAADAGDLTGLPEFEVITDIGEDGKEFTYKVTNFVLPDWFPRKPNTIVFFDEVNRGAKDILNGVFEAILDLSMKGIKMPKGCGIVSAMNPPTADYSGTIDFDDKAFADRFLHIKFQPTFGEFHSYQKSKFTNSGFLAYLGEDEKMLREGGLENFDLSFVKPSPRSWESCFALEQLYDDGQMDKSLFTEMVMGLVGIEAAIAGIAFKETFVGSIKGKDLIENYHTGDLRTKTLKAVSTGRTDLIGNALQEISAEFKVRKGLTNQEGKNIIKLIGDLSTEQRYTLAKSMVSAENINCAGNVEGMAPHSTNNPGGLCQAKELIDIFTETKKAREAAQAAKTKPKTKKVAEEV